MNIRTIIPNTVSALRGWLDSHREFFALKVSRLMAVVFLIVSLVFLAKSLEML